MLPFMLKFHTRDKMKRLFGFFQQAAMVCEILPVALQADPAASEEAKASPLRT